MVGFLEFKEWLVEPRRFLVEKQHLGVEYMTMKNYNKIKCLNVKCVSFVAPVMADLLLLGMLGNI